MACGILVPRPGIEPGPLAVAARSLNHWTDREFPVYSFSNGDKNSTYLQGCWENLFNN